MDEKWLPVPGYEEKYAVSNKGRIKSLSHQMERKNGITYSVKGRIVAIQKSINGYKTARLYNCGVGKSFTVHRLVMEAFAGKRPSGDDICHADGDKENNKLENLRYASRKDNCADTKKHGRAIYGERHHSAKLTEQEVIEIKFATGRHKDIAAKYGIGRYHVSSIKLGKTWAHLSNNLEDEKNRV